VVVSRIDTTMSSLQSHSQQDRRKSAQYHRVTIAALLGRELRRDGARPFLTWYDGLAGDRVELSVATTANWAAKIANHLVDELDLQPGDNVTVDPSLHWSTAVVLLGAWTAGAHVGLGGPPTLEFAVDAMGLGLSRLVANQPDEVLMPVDVAAESALTVGARTWSHEELGQAAVHGAQMHGLDASTRVLSVLGYDTVDGLDAGLLVPLAAGGSVVAVSNVDDRRITELCATERVTHTAGIDVTGMVRLDG
jgi:acyl-CoA synthetase (AMP-forming)/AMP-acid ligase II